MRQWAKSKFGSTPFVAAGGKMPGVAQATSEALIRTIRLCLNIFISVLHTPREFTMQWSSDQPSVYMKRTWNCTKNAFCANGSALESNAGVFGPVPNPEW